MQAVQARTRSMIDASITLVGLIIDTGDLAEAEQILTSLKAKLLAKEDHDSLSLLTELDAKLHDATQKEIEAGGPGSLYDPGHPFVEACRRARENVRRPFLRTGSNH